MMEKSVFNCADARHLIHLAVGDDTQNDEEARLTEHLHSCSDCRSYHAGMVDAMHALEQVRDSDSGVLPQGSLWPAMESQLKTRRVKNTAAPEGRRFNVAVAALCACSLLLAFVTAVQNLPSNSPEFAGDYVPLPASNVSYQGNVNSPPNMQSRWIELRSMNGEVYFLDTATGRTLVPNVTKPVGGLRF